MKKRVEGRGRKEEGLRTFPYGTRRDVLRLCCEKWNGNGSVTYPLAPFLKEGGMVMGRLHWDCDDAGGSGPGIEGILPSQCRR